MIFSRNPSSNCSKFELYKFYVELSDKAWKAGIVEALHSFLEFSKSKKFDFQLNDKKAKTLEAKDIDAELTLVNLHSLESLYIEGIDTREEFSVGLDFVYLDLPEKIYQIRYVVYNSKEFDFGKVISRLMCESFEVLYGYGRALDEGYDISSETKIRKGLFGGLKSGNVISPDVSWLMHPKLLPNGAAKGIYPFNIIKAKAMGDIGLSDEDAEELVDDLFMVQLSESKLKNLRSLGVVDKKFVTI